jgi:pimeloyl-ACP methyl ester carboxylesterase
MIVRKSLGLLFSVALSLSAQEYLTVDYPGAQQTFPTGVNSSGDVVGYYSPGFHGFLLHQGTFSSIECNGADGTIVSGINDSGDIVGRCIIGNGGPGFVMLAGTHQPSLLPFPSITSYFVAPAGINDSGEIVGLYGDCNPDCLHAFILNGGAYTMFDYPGQCPSPGYGTRLNGVDRDGRIVGSCGDPLHQSGFLLTSGGISSINRPGAFSTSPNGISTTMIVGNADNTCFIFKNGQYSTFAIPSAITRCFGISETGIIVGQYNGHGFVTLNAPVSITAVKMFDSHILQVDVTAQFSQDAATQKSITVKTTIQGVSLQSIFSSASATGTQSKSLFIDLAANNVPKFTDNQVFDVTATAIEGGSGIGTGTKTAEIPLPVVHVHGILTDCFGDRIPHGLFQYLQSAHPNAYTEDDGTWDGQANNHLTASYPSLVSFDYLTLQNFTSSTASQLFSWIQFELLPKTYASKVHVVAHSLGGIITRTAIQNYGAGQFINRLILVGSPTEGATLAAIGAGAQNFSFLKSLANLITLGLVSLGPGDPVPQVASVFSCIGSASNNANALDMLPTYPWDAKTQQDALNNIVSIPNGYGNSFLNSINNSLDPNVSYYAIVASGYSTPTLLWGKFFLAAVLEQFFGDAGVYGAGDGIVPLRSQTGVDILQWPRGNGPGKLNLSRPDGTLRDAGQVFHTGYFNNASVNTDVEQIVWGKQ